MRNKQEKRGRKQEEEEEEEVGWNGNDGAIQRGAAIVLACFGCGQSSLAEITPFFFYIRFFFNIIFVNNL